MDDSDRNRPDLATVSVKIDRVHTNFVGTVIPYPMSDTFLQGAIEHYVRRWV